MSLSIPFCIMWVAQVVRVNPCILILSLEGGLFHFVLGFLKANFFSCSILLPVSSSALPSLF